MPRHLIDDVFQDLWPADRARGELSGFIDDDHECLHKISWEELVSYSGLKPD